MRYDSLIVLDIDEVLNSLATQILSKGAWKEFDPVSVALLSSLIEETNAGVIISSSWRLSCRGDVELFRSKMMGEWREKVGKADITVLVNRIIDLCPYIPEHEEYSGSRLRGYEIQDALSRYPVNTPYVIFDDGPAVALPHQENNFVHVPAVDGLRLIHYWKALKILKPDHRRVKGLECYFNKKYYQTYVDQLIDTPFPEGEQE